jgi:SWI/SNF-related matrix-associated actin-dependent regulator 1 of chromatin subfamily A
MAKNLADQAQARLDALTARRAAAGAGLAAARTELDRRNPDPSSVDPDDWATELGATQHVATARAALAAIRAEQDRIRQALAAVANPADTETYEQQLRAALIADAGLRVRLREATERAAAASATVAEWSALAGRSEAAAGAAEADVAAATRWQADADALLDKLGEPPVDTVVADAAAMDRKPATDRLSALLPEALRKRALDRAGEAQALTAAEADAAAATGASRASARSAAYPLAVTAGRAEEAFLAALAGLRRYVGTAPADLAGARAALDGIAALPDLNAVQTDARAQQVRRELAVDEALAPRAGAAAAATFDRIGQYVRGDGPGGRTPAQL